MEEYFVPKPLSPIQQLAVKQPIKINDERQNSSAKVWWFIIIASLIIIGLGILAVF